VVKRRPSFFLPHKFGKLLDFILYPPLFMKHSQLFYFDYTSSEKKEEPLYLYRKIYFPPPTPPPPLTRKNKGGGGVEIASNCIL
jgi:hypothetical protein